MPVPPRPAPQAGPCPGWVGGGGPRPRTCLLASSKKTQLTGFAFSNCTGRAHSASGSVPYGMVKFLNQFGNRLKLYLMQHSTLPPRPGENLLAPVHMRAHTQLEKT
ncbi:unnamed protein product [Caretta caretta]